MSVLLHHVDDGPAQAPVLVLSGSLGSTLEMWEPNVPALVRHFRVVRIDQRGHGRSPAPPGPYTVAELAEDFLLTVDSLGIERFAWCGLSMGGAIGMYIASEHPERLTALALCATSARFDPRLWRQRADDVEQYGLDALAERVVERWFTPSWADEHPDAVRRAHHWLARTPIPGYLGCCEALATWDGVDRLAGIRTPTVILAGESDPVAPAQPHAELMRAGIPGARLAVLSAAHLLNIEAAQQVDELLVGHVLDALQAVRGPGGAP
jgi:3-oxoadipate enol-lactonase